ncbi:M15 family metallopeptidase [Heyndrickxia acidiproducens]|uniref:M15 family metallopeptidase n=1 Tax=Heyndrickxia acidiproducens TaxID=1121084 RepID=UPI00036C4117|nr:M15 family metallopeptidase [Heyndrickxia acidiproducens]
MKHFMYAGLAALLLTGCSLSAQDQPAKTDQQKPQSASQKKNTADSGDKKSASELQLAARYFNKTKTVEGKQVIQNPSNILALVNKTYILGDYVPKDLVRPNVQFSFGDQDIEKSYLRKPAAQALEEMFAAAKQDGIDLFMASGYRSYSRQKNVFDAESQKVGEEQAEQAVAIPGQSEHQTGLAADITSHAENFLLTQKMGEDKEGIWLAKNAHQYGFILRYPKNKERITKYEYEPWHFRYVGKKAAAVIYKHGWTLEEYFQHVKKI